ncbi:MAG TPA: OmpA family protein [Pyrinomonadaceae bacterium]|nr:OmpA family protein [Pyrinomonadaceae bacterium]HMP64305.1 OmpA family protein [Pyrinomonadaceae bacterium]
MSNSENNPGPPPDDFSKTVPNIDVPGDSGSNDWDKTNYNIQKQPNPDEWGKTVTNIKPIDTEGHDFGKTMIPGSGSVPEADWGATQANLRVPDTDFGTPADLPEGGFEKTTPYFQLPEAERLKYQNLPPTPTEQAAQEEKEKSKQGGIPGWVWVLAGLTTMFMFAVLVLLVVYLWFIPPTGFEIVVQSAPRGSTVRVDGVDWPVTRPDGSVVLQNLREGRKTITIDHPSFTCEPRQATVSRDNPKEVVTAQCRPAEVTKGEDCSKIGPGEEDRAERCYNIALAALKPEFTAKELVDALNILIINFETNRFDVPPRRLEALRKGATYIQKLPSSVVLEIGGHTDSDGTDATNQPLSDNRAKAVKDALVGFGVRPEVLEARGYGAKRPKTTNDTVFGKFQNRRIEYSIVKE